MKVQRIVSLFKRETGGNPVRSRRCNGEEFKIHATEIIGKALNSNEPKSEDLPLFMHQKLYGR